MKLELAASDAAVQRRSHLAQPVDDLVLAYTLHNHETKKWESLKDEPYLISEEH